MLHEHTTIEGHPAWHSPPGWDPFTYLPGRLWVESDVAREVGAFISLEATGTIGGFGDVSPEQTESPAQPTAVSQTDYGRFALLAFDRGSPLDNPVLRVLRAVETSHRHWYRRVWPEYVASLFEHTNYYPAGAPEKAGKPDVPTGNEGGGVKIGLVDVGFGLLDWDGNRPGGLPDPDVGPMTGLLAPAALHGELVAWVAKTFAPGAGLVGVSLLDPAIDDVGALLRSPTMPLLSVRRLLDGLRRVKELAPDIVVITAGAYIHPAGPPTDLMDEVAELAESAYVVASAGNDGSSTAAVYPAIDPQVLGVEAWGLGPLLRETPTCYTNRGGRHVAAPGSHVVRFLDVSLRVITRPAGMCSQIATDERVDYEGGARVHGTSFAAPAAAGLLARGGNFDPAQSARRRFESQLPERGFSL